ncbi:FMRFamide receptor [Contarinia nasturtii]|uniref:FMRFamide receptor n=1 Tax=Contarinia nasturtii TaxID=265458 RepID=UPI0012D37269|nr:FMRFamide receptor [Contarinia nasturtii]XP_031625699.1 FMRFamide receptor [Contarinia nasturtii]XP_031625700.1 FMRFamide receptor [Contarinia nasturtii]XP_031625701.1 FMRFamide receptor [Contarinia nasturtii]
MAQNDGEDWSSETLQQTRYIIQRIIVPCVVTIGIAGNLLTVIVLTRRRMRCSTNIYLTALALADIVNLFCAFVLSLQHYPGYRYGHVLYWSAFALSNWFHDASLYISIYLTVSFTLERYISVCHPLRGQVLCTESRAKKVITVVVVLCFLCTITTNFEYELNCTKVGYDYSKGERCISNSSINSIQCDVDVFDEICKMARFDESTGKPCQISNQTKLDGCQELHSYSVKQSNFSQSPGYSNFFYYPSILFGTLLPFVLLSILNAFLIWTVRKSHKMRHAMTNTRQDMSQENKVTITLIAVVILFFMCQTPNALQLLNIIRLKYHTNRNLVLNNVFNLLVTVNAASNFILYCVLSDKYRKTVKSLFCGVRSVRRNTISSSRFTSARTTSSFYSRSRNGNIFNMQRGPRFSISKEEYANLQAETAKRNRFSIATLTSQSRNNSIATENENAEEIQLKTTPACPPKHEKRRIKFSFTPSHLSLKHRSKNEQPAAVIKIDEASEEKPSSAEQSKIIIEPEQNAAADLNAPVAKRDSTISTHSFLRPSPSETSLTRSRSLQFPPKPKHSPDCKDNPYKL